MRVAWFSPLPPHRSGIAAYSAELLPRLARGHEIDAFVDDGNPRAESATAATVPGVRVLGAHDFPWRHARAPYDVTVYQLGNDICHDYMWPYMVRYPGLVTIHDAQLHQARARGLLRRHRHDDYRAEFRYSHPDAPPGVAELVVSGLVRPTLYLWPMTAVPAEAARCLALHSPWLVREFRGQFPDQPIVYVRQGVPDVLQAVGAAPAEVRRRHDIPEDAILFGAFGRVTPEKRLSDVLSALARLAPSLPSLRLLIAGEVQPDYDLAREAHDLGIGDRVKIVGYVEDAALPEYLRAVDVTVNLRWPTSRETSAAWLRCLSAGKPTIVSDLAHLGDVPALDLRSMTTASVDAPGAEPVCVSIDLMDQVHMLQLAWRHLGTDARLRERLARSARSYWQRTATIDLMAVDYEDALQRTRLAPAVAVPADWPSHLRADGASRARALADSLGLSLGWLA